MSKNWTSNNRWNGVKRVYSNDDVLKLRGSIPIEYTLARMGAERLWHLLHTEEYVGALGALTGNQALQQVQAGLKAIYLSGWQVAADANTAGQMYPDQSLYPADSVPNVVRRINQAFQRADQIQHSEGKKDVYWFAPIVADAEAGFGGTLNAYELMRAMIEAGAAGVHFEDQLASAKKCGHMGGKVLVPTMEFIQKLTAARLAADVMGVPTVIVARTDANGAYLLTSDIDPRDHQFLTGERTVEGFYRMRGGIDAAIARGLAYAPYADLVWCETSEPNLNEAKRFAEAIRAKYPEKLLAYNCSPSFNWKKKLDTSTISRFQRELASMGYKFQFVTLAGFHSLNHGMFSLAKDYRERGMSAYADYQEFEFRSEKDGYRATTHQKFVGTGYFDLLAQKIAEGALSTMALEGSTEVEQFQTPPPAFPGPDREDLGQEPISA
jgi:isocitrate lyase